MNEIKGLEFDNKTKWYMLSVEDVVKKLKSDTNKGLSDHEYKTRRAKFGKNEFQPKKKKSLILKFLQGFNQPLIYILLIAGTITFFLNEFIEAGVIYGVTIINAIIGFIQEAKAENAIAALVKSVKTKATVIRDGKKIEISASKLVPGDIVLLSSGAKVPADLRIIEVKDLQTNEAFLTGESMPVSKTQKNITVKKDVADRNNIAYAGSLVTYGTGKGIVVAIGNETQTGQISKLIDESEGLKTPFMIKIEKFSKTLLYIILSLAVITFLISLFKGLGWVEGFKGAVALAVSAIPEGLPAIVTVTLAIGVSRMAGKHAIVRKLSAVETLGSTTVICSDKTGTLTKNQMTVQEIFSGDIKYKVTGIGYEPEGDILRENNKLIDKENFSPSLTECLKAGLLCNDSHIELKEETHIVIGDPTEGALIVSAQKAGFDQNKLSQQFQRIDSIPFESEHQYMSTIHKSSDDSETNKKNIIYLKGSVEVISERCNQMIDETGSLVPFDKNKVLGITNAMAEKGLRVLAFAKREVESSHDSLSREDVTGNLLFIGLQAMIDPPRVEVIKAVKACKTAGIRVKMITGDHCVTAREIARQIDILEDQDAPVYKGSELQAMSDEKLQEAVSQASVFSRVPPEIKLKLVKAFQFKNEVVAMTGDGVNDGPALKQADIGIAMGGAGTEVAKEASDMVLTDDNFASIEAAVEEGRTVYLNLLKVIGFILPVNGGEMLTILAGILFVEAIPILPVQILWINMLSSVALSIPLAFEPKRDGIMDKPPRNSNEPLLSKGLIIRIILISIFNLFASFGVFEYIMLTTDNLNLARTMAVHTLVAAECFYLLTISDFASTLVGYIKKRDKLAYMSIIGILCVAFLQFILSQLNVMNSLFGTVPISLNQGLICIGAGLSVVIPGFIAKKFVPLS